MSKCQSSSSSSRTIKSHKCTLPCCVVATADVLVATAALDAEAEALATSPTAKAKKAEVGLASDDAASRPQRGIRHRPIIVCGPSGAGKTTMLERLMQAYPTRFACPVSDTTRAPRANEVDGTAYHFIDAAAFQAKIDMGDYVEHVRVHGNAYGLSHAALELAYVNDRQNLLIMDVHGCRQMRVLGYHPCVVWINAPSHDELRHRLVARDTDAVGAIETRMQTAEQEETYQRLHPNEFDIALVNDDADVAFAALCAALDLA